ncbi:unnamed protein product [Arctogadus glacialis]
MLVSALFLMQAARLQRGQSSRKSLTLQVLNFSVNMAPVGREFLGSWMLSTATVSPDMGVFSLLLLLIISIFVTSLCSSCARRTFDMTEPVVEDTPSELTKVAKLEDSTTSAKENPLFNDIKIDEYENTLPVQSSEDESVPSYTPWRCHLVPQKQPEGGDYQVGDLNTPAEAEAEQPGQPALMGP